VDTGSLYNLKSLQKNAKSLKEYSMPPRTHTIACIFKIHLIKQKRLIFFHSHFKNDQTKAERNGFKSHQTEILVDVVNPSFAIHIPNSFETRMVSLANNIVLHL